MTTVDGANYQVGLTFAGATIQINNESIESQLNSKAPKSHTHTIDQIDDLQTTLDDLTNDCIKVETGNASITGNLTCNDVNFKYDNTSTSLATKLKSMTNESMTIQHLTITADSNVRVGYPVFYTGQITGKNFSPLTISSTDCVPIVKASGDWSTFAGICTEVDVPYYNKATIKYKGIEHAFIRFATHGDFQMAVDDSSKYKVGDIITYEGNIINPNDNIDYKTMRSIVGSVSAIVKNNSIAIFRI